MLRFRLWALLGGVLLAGCVTVPSGPGVVVLPGKGKTFEQFREEDAVCRHYAQYRVGATPEQAAAHSVARSAGTGALVGAAAGALIGAGSHDPALGAAIGAGSGLLVGGVAGSAAGGTAADAVQGRYDISYVQCMYAKGNQVPPPPGTPGHPLPPPPHAGANLPPPPP
ncbi:MAG: glycine zipper family protein [Gammaproteobacteria bacterium]